MYGLCDCNNFFASCERVFRPDLEGKPVIVLSNNDGCVVARSNEAKKAGVAMGVPAYQIKDLIRKAGITVFSANYALYGDISARVMATLREFVPNIEIYSIDEAFFDLSGISDPEKLGRDIRQTILKNVGVPVSIGISPTKTLAKIASKLAKSYPKLNGCCYMHRPQDIKKVLSTYPLTDIWGIGRRYGKRFTAMGITTAQQFVEIPRETIQSGMGITGLKTWQELQGIPCIPYEANPDAKHQISISRSFPKEIYTLETLEDIVSEFTSRAAEKLRGQNSMCLEIGVFIYTNIHHENDAQHCESTMASLPDYTDSTIDLVKQARMLLRRIYRKQYGYKRAGIWLSHFIDARQYQHSLFEDSAEEERNKKLMSVLDDMNRTFGRSTVKLGSEGLTPFKMNREHLSPRYTTDWNELLTVK